MFIVAQKSTPKGILVVVTDKDVIGKEFEEGKKYLDLTKKFYQGGEMSKDEIIPILKKSYIIHFTGKHSVQLGLDEGLIEKIITVDGVPHAEVLLE